MKPLLPSIGAAIISAICILAASCGWQSENEMENREKSVVFQRQLKQLESEADRLEDVRTLKRLQRAYGYYVDQGLWSQAADLFAPQGTIEIGLDGVYVGRERVRQYLVAYGGGREGLRHGQLNEHLMLQPVVHVAADGGTAKARWRALIMAGQLGESAFWGEGVYENEYIKENGIWKISKLHWYQTFMVPYKGGWAKNPDSTGGIYVSKRLPPDRPPSESYEVWPGVYTPPFHYKNPTPVSSDKSMETDPSLAMLAHRIRLLQDIEEIENLISMYGYYLDKQQWNLLTDLFVENATMEISQRGVYVGKKSIMRAWELFGPQNIARNHLHNHIQIQPVIHVAPDGQRAWVRSRALSQLGTFGAIGIWGDGVYENELVKEKGVWKIKKDHVYTAFFAPYDTGWAMGARPTPKASDKIPPDKPPSEIYESFPEIYIPPFHYKNPAADQSATAKPESGAGTIPKGERAEFGHLSGKIQRLEDESAIENLQRIYGFYVDKQLWKEAADLFTDDGTLEIGGQGVFAGKSRVLKYLDRISPAGLTRGKLFNHLQLQPIIDVTPDANTAKGRWRFLSELGEYKKSATWCGGAYENEYVKEGTTWKIKALHAYSRFCTPYADGWGKSALPGTRSEKSFPPDRPPTVSYDPYPATLVAPFHYKNPVTGK
ncbi:MAG: nuclear transport factor 2 family protein [Acidobacteriota bacterium]